MSNSQQPLREVSLASQSPRRKQLLEQLGLRVVVIPSSYDDAANAVTHGDPARVAGDHAQAKARDAAQTGPPVVVAADTIVAIDGELLGKPRDAAQAREMLARLSGREHQVYTGFAISDRSSGHARAGVESTRVRFVQLDRHAIDAYVASGDPLDKAGAYGIQGRGAMLVASIDGDFYTVMGLPVARVVGALLELGYDMWAR